MKTFRATYNLLPVYINVHFSTKEKKNDFQSSHMKRQNNESNKIMKNVKYGEAIWQKTINWRKDEEFDKWKPFRIYVLKILAKST